MAVLGYPHRPDLSVSELTNWRGGTDCWCPPHEGKDIEKYGNNGVWYHSGNVLPRSFSTSEFFTFAYYQGDNFAQNWAGCDSAALTDKEPNVIWAVSHCEAIHPQTGAGGWGNQYELKTLTAPLHVGYAMRCEYPAQVAPNCLCHEKKTPEGGAQMCIKKMTYYESSHPNGEIEWGKYDYSSHEYCTKLNVATERPIGTECMENAHCTVGLKCSGGVCSKCFFIFCGDRTPSDGLSRWKNTCKYGDINCAGPCSQKGALCGGGCCPGLKCSSQNMCTEEDAAPVCSHGECFIYVGTPEPNDGGRRLGTPEPHDDGSELGDVPDCSHGACNDDGDKIIYKDYSSKCK